MFTYVFSRPTPDTPQAGETIEIVEQSTLTPESFNETLLSNKYSVIKLFSPYCPHCVAFSPDWMKIIKSFDHNWETTHKTVFKSLNCVEQGDLCLKEGVKSMPELFIYKFNESLGISNKISSFPKTKEKNYDNVRNWILEEIGIDDQNITSSEEVETNDKKVKDITTIDKESTNKEETLKSDKSKDAGFENEKSDLKGIDDKTSFGSDTSNQEISDSTEDYNESESKGIDDKSSFGSDTSNQEISDSTKDGKSKSKGIDDKSSFGADTSKQETTDSTKDDKESNSKGIDDKSSFGSDTNKHDTSDSKKDDKSKGTDDKSSFGSDENNKQEIEIPPSLTIETFDKSITENLRFIKFYSPYCSHCIEQAPIWKKAYNQLHSEKEDERLGIFMETVNCFENGDLCSREGIDGYPTLVVYHPNITTSTGNSVLAEYPNDYMKSNEIVEWVKLVGHKYIKGEYEQQPEGNIFDMLRLEDDLKGDTPTSSSNDNPSKQIDDKFIIDSLTLKNLKTPIMISLWPKNDDENDNSCPECDIDFKIWNKFSNSMGNEKLTIGHLNCHSHESICSKLIGSVVNKQSGSIYNSKIRMVRILTIAHGSVIEYTDSLKYSDLYQYGTQIVENYETKEIDLSKLKSLLGPSSKEGKSIFVYYYDEKSSVSEDFDILPHLFETIITNPFNTYLYKSKDKEILNFINEGEESVRNELKFNKIDEKLKSNEKLLSLPTLLNFKQGSKLVEKFINSGTNDIRDLTIVKNWILKNIGSMIADFTPYKTYWLLNDKDSKYDYFVLSIMKPDTETFSSTINNLKSSYNNFKIEKDKIILSKLLKLRNEKDLKIENAKSSTDPNLEQKIRTTPLKIPDYKNVQFGSINGVVWQQYLKLMGWGSSRASNLIGKVLIIDKKSSKYWDTTIDGKRLSLDPKDITDDLKYIIFGKDANFEKTPKLKAKKAYRPNKKLGYAYTSYQKSIKEAYRYGTTNHSVGIMVFIGLLITFFIYRRWRTVKDFNRRKLHGLGLLGTTSSQAAGKFD